jgi:hypothetical protein
MYVLYDGNVYDSDALVKGWLSEAVNAANWYLAHVLEQLKL